MTGPNPGWLFRASLASCTATMIAMRAAQIGLTMTSLEVSVSSESDSRADAHSPVGCTIREALANAFEIEYV